MKKTSKDLIINILAAIFSALTLLVGCWAIILAPIIFFVVRALLRRALYDQIDRLERRFQNMHETGKLAAVKQLSGSTDIRAREMLFDIMTSTQLRKLE